jgi:hypothetical protein
MRRDTDALIAERDSINNELAQLKKTQVTLENEQAEITRKVESSAGDKETSAQLKIATEQVAEAKRQNDRLIAQTAKRLTEIEKIIIMQEQSDIV